MTLTAPSPTATEAATPRTDATFVPTHPDDAEFVDLAARIGAIAAEHAPDHDRDASFVAEAYEAMKATGYLGLVVPTELGGLGATIRQACFAQAELARHDGATALASTMHLYNALVQTFRRRAGAPDAEGVLRRIVDEGLVIATSGGSDWLWVDTVATPTERGFVVSGRKHFCSQAPGATVLATSAVVDAPGPGSEVIHFSVPLGSPGVRIEPTWDTLGMRGTASHDVVLDQVEVPAERIAGRRPWGELGGPLKAAVVHFAPLGAATYLGIAAGARDAAVRAAADGSRGPAALADLPSVHRQVGSIDATLRSAWWSVLGSLDEVCTDGVIAAADAATLATVTLAKREAVLAAIDVVDRSMDLGGGRSYFRSSPLERAHRDVRAGTFHPLTPEVTLAFAGRLALGAGTDTE
jgi:acyl-CoA dehydrogenase